MNLFIYKLEASGQWKIIIAENKFVVCNKLYH